MLAPGEGEDARRIKDEAVEFATQYGWQSGLALCMAIAVVIKHRAENHQIKESKNDE